MGSTREARRAGSQEASATPAERTRAAPSQMNGSAVGISGHWWMHEFGSLPTSPGRRRKNRRRANALLAAATRRIKAAAGRAEREPNAELARPSGHLQSEQSVDADRSERRARARRRAKRERKGNAPSPTSPRRPSPVKRYYKPRAGCRPEPERVRARRLRESLASPALSRTKVISSPPFASQRGIGRQTVPTTSPSRGSTTTFVSATRPTTVYHGRGLSRRPCFTRLPIGSCPGQKRRANDFVHDADRRRIDAVGLGKVAAAHEALSERREISGTSPAHVGEVSAARFRRMAPFRDAAHQVPRRFHWRRRGDCGGTHSRERPQFSQGGLDCPGASFRRIEQPVGEHGVKGQPVIGGKSPRFADYFAEILREGEAADEQDRGDGDLGHDQSAQKAPRAAIQSRSAADASERAAQIGARGAPGRQQTKADADERASRRRRKRRPANRAAPP